MDQVAGRAGPRGRGLCRWHFDVCHLFCSSDELLLGHENTPAFRDLQAVAAGNKDHDIRAREPKSGLSAETQVKCLINQATDPNLLGRTWAGWEPWL